MLDKRLHMSAQPPYKYKAFIYNVVDGDTIDARVDLGFTVSVDVRFRLAGLDTPELHSSDSIVREAAQRAKQFTSDKVSGKNVLLESVKADKYGRWLAKIYLPDSTCLNDILLSEHLAVEYSGGTRG